MAKKRQVQDKPSTQKPTKPRRARQKKLTGPAHPLVPMPMPWMKPEGVTVSYVCPTCCARRLVTPQEARRLTELRHVPLDELACSEACRTQWLRVLRRTIAQTMQTQVWRDLDWAYELSQGVVAERLSEVFQGVTSGG